MRVLIALVTLAALGLAFRFAQRRPAPEREHQDKPAASVALSLPRQTTQKIPATPTFPTNLSAHAEESPPQLSDSHFDLERFQQDSEYSAKVRAHMELRYYESSPAKDTPEAHAILDLCLREGLDRAAVPAAYNLAYEVNQIASRHLANGGTLEGADLLLGPIRQMHEERFMGNFGLTNPSAFFRSLYQVKPTLFFGQRNSALPAVGEPLLE